MAFVRIGNLDLKEVGEDSLPEVGKHECKFTRTFEAFRFWEDEALDLRHVRDILQDQPQKTRGDVTWTR
jgi:hypothetical protein